MENHKTLNALAPRLLTQDGTASGEIFCDVSGFRVGQQVSLKSNSVPEQSFTIDKILDDRLKFTSSMIQFLVVDGAIVYSNSQERPKFSTTDVERATYEEAPVVARRSFAVDEFGNPAGSAASQILSDDPIALFKYDEFMNVVQIIEVKILSVGSICKRTYLTYNENLAVIKIESVQSILQAGDI